MKCYHLLPAGTTPLCRDYVWLDVGGGNVLLAHSDQDGCSLTGSCGHLLLPDPIPSAVATALASYGILGTDSCVAMALKMAAHFPPFRP